MIGITDFLSRQFRLWPEVGQRHIEASGASTRVVDLGKWAFTLQHNPARVRSTGADTSPQAIASRPCFLCPAARPPQQEQIPCGRFSILINPFPIFPGHLTIASVAHQPQRIAPAMPDMLELSRLIPGYTLFYNGPQCGASAPDHLHFQAVPSKNLPLISNIPLQSGIAIPDFPFGIISLAGESPASLCDQFDAITRALPSASPETPLNILCTFHQGCGWQVIIIPRKAHRPACYPTPLISPASIDLAGVIVTPRLDDFETLSPGLVSTILDDVTLSVARLKTILS